MAFVLGAVDGPLHRAQHRVVDRVLARVALHLVEQLLQLEAVLEVVDFEAQLADELGEQLQLPRIGAAVHAAQEDQAGVRQQLGHRLVGRQHELLDDLVALGVLCEMGAGDAAVLVEIDLHLRHRELERAALRTAGRAGSSPARASGPSSVDAGVSSRRRFVFSADALAGRRRSPRYSSTSSYVNRRRLLIALLNTSVATQHAFLGQLHHAESA